MRRKGQGVVTVDRYRYQVVTTPTCGLGLKQTEVAAASLAAADVRVAEMVGEWTRGFAEQDRIDYEWSVSRNDRLVASGTSRPSA